MGGGSCCPEPPKNNICVQPGSGPTIHGHEYDRYQCTVANAYCTLRTPSLSNLVVFLVHLITKMTEWSDLPSVRPVFQRHNEHFQLDRWPFLAARYQSPLVGWSAYPRAKWMRLLDTNAKHPLPTLFNIHIHLPAAFTIANKPHESHGYRHKCNLIRSSRTDTGDCNSHNQRPSNHTIHYRT